MKTFMFTTLIMFLFTINLIGQEITVMSYNIKYDNNNDTINNWNDRKKEMSEMLQTYSPSFIGMQEVLQHQLLFLDSSLANYSFIGVGRDDGHKKGEFSPILYDSIVFKVIKSNTIWLSETPSKISVGWDASMERICTYGLFKDIETGKQLWVFNTHFDHIGVKAREESTKLILKTIENLNENLEPVILMGDLNLMPETLPIKILYKEMSAPDLTQFEGFEGPKGTYNAFNIKNPITRRIDYIFSRKFNFTAYKHLDIRLKSGKHISDHLPVLAILNY